MRAAALCFFTTGRKFKPHHHTCAEPKLYFNGRKFRHTQESASAVSVVQTIGNILSTQIRQADLTVAKLQRRSQRILTRRAARIWDCLSIVGQRDTDQLKRQQISDAIQSADQSADSFSTEDSEFSAKARIQKFKNAGL